MLLRLVVTALSVLYPLAVYLGLQHFDPRTLVLLLLSVAALRALSSQESPLNHWLWLPLLGVLALWVAMNNTATGLKLYPVLVNMSLLAVFAWSLKYPPTVIERLARRSNPDLDEAGRRYTARVTQVWCAFFVLNGVISLATAFWASEALWALYNGLIAYLLIGALLGGEWLLRQWIVRKAHD